MKKQNFKTISAMMFVVFILQLILPHTVSTYSETPVAASFSEDEACFDESDSDVSNGTAGNFITVSDMVYMVDMEGDAAQDAAGDENMAETQFSVTYGSEAVSSVSAYQELISAVAAASDGDIIDIAADIVVEAEVSVSKSLMINGNGHNISVPVPGFADSGVFNTDPSNFCVFNIASGTVTIKDATIKGGAKSGRGSGISVTSGATLYLDTVTVSNSGKLGCSGGGIVNSGTAYLNNCNIIRNGASYGGGFLNLSSGKMFVENCSFSENRSLSGGGGAGENQGYLYINNSTFSNNKSTELGGAINNYRGTGYILNSTFTGNVSIHSSYAAGALRCSGNLYLINDIFAYNYGSANGSSYSLNDFNTSFWSGVTAYGCIFHGSVYSGGGANNTQYSGNADGSDDALFTGGSTSPVLAADGSLVSTATVYQPYLAKVAGSLTTSVPLKSGSNALSAGITTAFTNGNGTPVIGYKSGETWTELTGSNPENYQVTADQNGSARSGSAPAIGAVESTVDTLYMVKVNAAAHGTVSGGSIYGDTYSSGVSITLTAIPESGYKFSEWQDASTSTRISGENPYIFEVTSDITLVPVFTALGAGEYTITYVGNGNTSGVVPDCSGTTYTAPATIAGNTGNLAKVGYVFDGWNTRENGSGTSYSAGDSYSAGENMTLYAQWTETTAAPTASDVQISGTPQMGETLTGSYTYNDPNGGGEGTSTFKWYRADDSSGTNKTEISGATAITYVSQPEDIGKYISFEVTPVAESGGVQGAAAESAAVGPVEKSAQEAVSYDNVTKTYGDADFIHTAAGGSGTGTFSYESSDPSVATIDASNGSVTIKKAGTSTLTATKAGDSEYLPASQECTLTVNQAELTATVGDYNKIYGEENPSFTVTVTGFVSGETDQTALDYITPIASSTATAGTGAGTAEITISGGSAANYTFDLTDTGTLTINKKDLTATAAADDKTYDGGTAATGTISLEGIYGTDDVSAEGSFAFGDANVGADKTVNVTGITLKGAKAGNYTANDTATTTAKISIKAATVIPDSSLGKIYSSSDPTLTYTVSDLVYGDSLTGALSREPGEDAGSYAIVIGSLSNINYQLTLSPESFTITPKELTVVGISVSKTYDGTADATQYVSGAALSGIVNNDDVSLDAANMTAVFDNKDIGANKTVTISGYALTGTKAGNYTVKQPTGITGIITSETADDVTVQTTTSYDGSWTKEDVTVTLSGEASSGIQKYQYSVDNGVNWVDIDGSSRTFNQTIDADVIFRAINNGGIASNPSAVVTLKVDKTKPVIENITGNPTEPVNSEQVIAFAVYDVNSGVDTQNIIVKKGETILEVMTETEGIYSFTTQGNGEYQITVSDSTGNVSEKAVNVIELDFDKPLISTLSPANNELNTEADSLTVAFNEDIKKAKPGVNGDIVVYHADGTVFERVDIQNHRIKISGQQMKIYFTKPFEKNQSYYVNIVKDIVCDLAGNSFDGIADKTTWAFKTKGEITINRLLGIYLVVHGEQYPAVVDNWDDTKFSTIAEPNTDGTVEAVISPVLLDSGADVVISTEDDGVTITGSRIHITDTAKKKATFHIQIKNADGTMDSMIYTLIINKGSMETKVENTNITAESSDLTGALDVSSHITNGKQLQLLLDVADNESTLTDTQKSEIKSVLGDQTIALYIDITLMLNNITDNTSDEVHNTQNPITIRILLPESMRGGSDYKVIRSHNGVIEIIEAKLDGNYIVFETDRFSQYAIAYTEPKKKHSSSSSSSSSIAIVIPTDEHTPYINGYSDGTFRPDSIISRAEAAAILSRLSESFNEDQYYANGFSDVNPHVWYANYVGFGSQNGMIKGYEDGSFLPDGQITRAEFAALIVRFKALSASAGYDKIFSDISGHWAEANIMKLYAQGWITGYADKTFKPDEPITRAEAVKIINAAIGRTPSKEKVDASIGNYKNPFSDVVNRHWAYYEILEAAVVHIVTDFH